MQAWLQEYVLDRHREGGLAVPPPVLTRLHAVLSDAMLGYEQCRCASGHVDWQCVATGNCWHAVLCDTLLRYRQCQ